MRNERSKERREALGWSWRLRGGLGFACVFGHRLRTNFFLFFPENPGLYPRAWHSCSRDPLTKD
jgi:hypothetical protein